MSENGRGNDVGLTGSPQEARAALDALSGISSRRDELLDRRRLGGILLVDAIIPTAAFTSWILAQALRDDSVSTHSIPALATLVVVLLWDQLARGLRERYRARAALHGARRAVQNALSAVGAGILVVAVFLTFLRGEAPVVLAVIGSILLISSGVWAAGVMMREAKGTPRMPPAEHAVMNVAGRFATFFFGLGSGSIAMVGPLAAAPGGTSAFVVILAVIALVIAGAGRFLNAIPELGAMWRPPQWVAFALSTAIVLIAPVLGALRPAEAVLFGMVAGGAVLLVFGAAALWPVGSDA